MTGNAKPLGDLIFKHYTLSLSMTSSIRTHFHRFGDWFSQTYPGLLLKNIGKTVKQFSEPCFKKNVHSFSILEDSLPGDTWRFIHNLESIHPWGVKNKTHQVAQLLQICLSKLYRPNRQCHPKKVVLVKESSQPKFLVWDYFLLVALIQELELSRFLKTLAPHILGQRIPVLVRP